MSQKVRFIDGKKIIADLNVNLKSGMKRTDYVAYKSSGCILACSIITANKKMGESIACVQDQIDRFTAELNENNKYMERRDDKKDCRMLNDLGAWMAERAIQAHQTHSEVPKEQIKQYTSGYDSSLTKVKQILHAL